MLLPNGYYIIIGFSVFRFKNSKRPILSKHLNLWLGKAKPVNQCSLVDWRYRRSKFVQAHFFTEMGIFTNLQSLENHLHERVRMRSKLYLKAQKQLYRIVLLTQISSPNIDSCVLLCRATQVRIGIGH